jgi:hypothetical protein
LKAGLECTALCGGADCQNGQKENIEDTDEENILGSDSPDIDQDSEDDDDVFEE